MEVGKCDDFALPGGDDRLVGADVGEVDDVLDRGVGWEERHDGVGSGAACVFDGLLMYYRDQRTLWAE